MWFQEDKAGPILAPSVLAQPAEDPESERGGTEKQRQRESTGKVTTLDGGRLSLRRFSTRLDSRRGEVA